VSDFGNFQGSHLVKCLASECVSPLEAWDVPNRLGETGDPEMGPSECSHVRTSFAPRGVDVPAGVGSAGCSDVSLMRDGQL
jgi:hypothetical protein